MPSVDLNAWAGLLRRVAGEHAQPGAVIAGGDAARAFLAFRHNRDPGDRPASLSRDAALWWAMHDPSIDPASHIDDAAQDAPLFRQRPTDPIEVWTECELSGMQAVWRLARERSADATQLRKRALLAAAWHLEHTQPDNATNRPWAIPVFLHLECVRTDGAASYYAQTLLHNCMAGMSSLDPLCVEILLDAAELLESAAR